LSLIDVQTKPQNAGMDSIYVYVHVPMYGDGGCAGTS